MMKTTIINYAAHVLAKYDKLIGNRANAFCREINSRRKSLDIKQMGGICIRKDAKIINPQWMVVGRNLTVGDRVTLSTWLLGCQKPGEISTPKLIIGNDCRFGDDSHITAANSITIGDNLLTGKKVLISDNSHGYVTADELNTAPLQRPITSKGGITIGSNVWIGENAAILQNVTIGDGAIIGANAVVTKDVPPYSIAVGNPAKTKILSNQTLQQ